MSFIEEYGLLIAVSLPALMIVTIQVFLFISGERGTLLLPGSTRFECDSQAEGASSASEGSTAA